MADKRQNIDIPVGWVAFYNPDTKKVFGITEFKSPSRGFTQLTIMVKPSKAELIAEFARQELLWSEPAIPPAPPQPVILPTPPATPAP